ncbi:MAG: hypothetical protein A3B79_03845 [Deltaproteobacteria bacterium RIFCSPHIGHO2_02_FULL_50_15]|nr:MAG: hypothetical protein A3B79_03845 [Deltaproteobacteria bacterium RIFCSPHIGHO2_02_FULL_50_15]
MASNPMGGAYPLTMGWSQPLPHPAQALDDLFSLYLRHPLGDPHESKTALRALQASVGGAVSERGQTEWALHFVRTYASFDEVPGLSRDGYVPERELEDFARTFLGNRNSLYSFLLGEAERNPNVAYGLGFLGGNLRAVMGRAREVQSDDILRVQVELLMERQVAGRSAYEAALRGTPSLYIRGPYAFAVNLPAPAYLAPLGARLWSDAVTQVEQSFRTHTALVAGEDGMDFYRVPLEELHYLPRTRVEGALELMGVLLSPPRGTPLEEGARRLLLDEAVRGLEVYYLQGREVPDLTDREDLHGPYFRGAVETVQRPPVSPITQKDVAAILPRLAGLPPDQLDLIWDHMNPWGSNRVTVLAEHHPASGRPLLDMIAYVTAVRAGRMPEDPSHRQVLWEESLAALERSPALQGLMVPYYYQLAAVLNPPPPAEATGRMAMDAGRVAPAALRWGEDLVPSGPTERADRYYAAGLPRDLLAWLSQVDVDAGTRGVIIASLGTHPEVDVEQLAGILGRHYPRLARTVTEQGAQAWESPWTPQRGVTVRRVRQPRSPTRGSSPLLPRDPSGTRGPSGRRGPKK